MNLSKYRLPLSLLLAFLALSAQGLFGQGAAPGGGGGGRGGRAGGGRGGRGGPPPTAKQAAPVDLTGYWTAVIVEDWKYRMIAANKGDYQALPLSAEGRKIADSFDPTKGPAWIDDCRNYGAANLMRMPGRLHITWQDDETLKLEADAGTQTRTLAFKPSQAGAGTWQGVADASWDSVQAARGFARGAVSVGGLKVITTQLKPGFLRSNGAPYSDKATVTQYFDRIDFPDNSYLLVTTTVDDPVYLNAPYVTSSHFRKQADASGWKPTACR